MNLIQTIEGLSDKQLNRMKNSQKNYFFFDISMFNVGAVIRVICTDNYREINHRTWNGYNSIHENDRLVHELILAEIKDRKESKQSKN
jgi:hypothetical protein